MKAISGYFKRTLSVRGVLLLMLIIPATSLAQPSTPDSLQAERLLSKGLTLKDQANYSQANELLMEASTLFEQASYPFRAAHVCNHISSNYRRMGEYDLAREQANRALDLISDLAADDYTEHIRAYTNLGLIVSEYARYDEALELLDKAYNLIDDPSVSPFLKTTVLGSIGYLQDDLGHYDEALAYYEESLDIINTLEDPPKGRLAKLYNNIGYTYTNKGQFRTALQFYKKELELNLEVKGDRHPDVAIAYINIGSSYYRRGDYGQALLYFRRSLDTALSAHGKEHVMTAIIYDNLALCQLKTGNYFKAISNFEQAIDINKSLFGSDHPELAINLKNLARAYASLKDYRRSLGYTQKALNIQLHSLGEQHPRLLDTYNQLGTYFAQLSHADSAYHYLNKATELEEGVLKSNHPAMAQTYSAMALAKKAEGRYRQAVQQYQKSLALLADEFNPTQLADNPPLSNIQYPVYASEILFDKALMLRNIYGSKGDIKYLRASLSTFYSLSQLLDKRQMSYEDSQSKLDVVRKSHEIYEYAIQTAYDLYQVEKNSDGLEHIFYFIEKSKGRMMLEAAVRNGAEQYANIPDTLLQYGQSLEDRINAARQQMDLVVSGALQDDEKLGRLRDSLISLNRQLSDYANLLNREYPRYHALKFANPIPSIEQVQQRLKESGHTVLEYFWGKKSLFALIVTPGNMSVHKLPFDGRLSKLINNFNKAITKRHDKDYRDIGYKLHQRLIAPVASLLPSSKQLLVVPDGKLALLPFEALLTDEVQPPASESFRDLPYLLMKYDISYAPSFTLSSIMQNRQRQEYEYNFLAFAPGFADGVPGWEDQTGYVSRSSWQPLPFTKMEVADIAALFYEDAGIWDYLFGNSTASLFLNREASERSLKRAIDLDARYIHLATHAFVSEQQPELAGILLYPDKTDEEDGILFAHEVYNLSMNAELVVLSACDTGRGSVVKGEGIMSLSRAFQYAGADNLLVSLWKVEDRSSSKLMIEFYRSLLANPDKTEALRMAKRDLIEGVEYAHPFYWAPFVLIGA